MHLSVQGVDSAQQVCVCFQAWSINPFSSSGPLQTCENTVSLLSCGVALAMLLTSEGLDGIRCHLTLLCASTQSDGRQRLHGSQRFSLQQIEGNRREKGQGVPLPLFGSGLFSASCVSKETIFQDFCPDFAGISFLTAFLPWARMPAGSSLTLSCGLSEQMSAWETEHHLQQGAGSGMGQLNGQRGPFPERLGRRGICPWEMHPWSLACGSVFLLHIL